MTIYTLVCPMGGNIDVSSFKTMNDAVAAKSMLIWDLCQSHDIDFKDGVDLDSLCAEIADLEGVEQTIEIQESTLK